MTMNKEITSIVFQQQQEGSVQHDCAQCPAASSSEVSSPATHPHDRYINPSKSCNSSSVSNLLISFLDGIVDTIFPVVFIVFVAIISIAIHVAIACTIIYRKLHHRRRTGTSTASISSEEQEEEEIGGGVSSGGLSLSDLQNLSSFKYEMVEPAQDCIICLGRFVKGERCRSLSGCKHVYHAKCVDSWLVRVPSCPLCRQIVVKPGVE